MKAAFWLPVVAQRLKHLGVLLSCGCNPDVIVVLGIEAWRGLELVDVKEPKIWLLGNELKHRSGNGLTLEDGTTS